MKNLLSNNLRTLKNLSMPVIVAAVLSALTAGAAASPYTISADSISKHIGILASDSLEGRETGEPGEWKAALYVASIMEAAGLVPKGDDGTWFQAFDFIKEIPKTNTGKTLHRLLKEGKTSQI